MRVIKFLLVLGLLGAVIGSASLAALVWHFSQDLPSTEGLRDLRLQVPLRIYTSEGDLIGEYGAERREPILFQDIPPRLVQAFLAAEDDRFFQHPGVDYQGLLRAAWVLVLTGEKAQGGSTITMQLARNFFLSSEKSYVRKFREILLAIEMEKQLSKEEILAFYLNKIFLGHRAYGIGAAAKVYYGVELDELSLAQMAMIAGLPKAPSLYNPISGPQRALLRRNYVLRRMYELKYISEDEFNQARQEEDIARLRRGVIDVEAHYAAEYVRGRIINQFGIEAYTDGIEVYTTLQSARQRAAVVALRENLRDYDRRHGYRGAEASLGELGDELASWPAERLQNVLGPLLEEFPRVGGLLPALVVAVDEKTLNTFAVDTGLLAHDIEAQDWPKDIAGLQVGDVVRLLPQDGETWTLSQVPEVQGALVAIDPANGAVRAMSGGYDYFASKFNRAMQAQRQPGSAFKPFVYSAALEHGFNPASIINDAPVVFHDAALGGAWRPENYTGRFYGPTPMREGLVRSSNLVSIRLLDAIGVGPAREHIARFGLDPERVPRNLSMALGTGSFTPLEMAQGYATFANGGHRVTPYLIERIVTAEGELLHQARPETVCDAACQGRRLRADQAALARDADAAGASELADDATREADLPPPLAPRVISAANDVSVLKYVILFAAYA